MVKDFTREYPKQQAAAIEKALQRGDRAAMRRLRERGYVVLTPEQVADGWGVYRSETVCSGPDGS